MEKRAVRVSHELWKQMFTEGYTSGGIRCVKGLPEDARLVGVKLHDRPDGPDPIFLFESDQWAGPAQEYPFDAVDGKHPGQEVVFQTAECLTCKHWDPSSHKLTGECVLTRDDDYVPDFKESRAHAKAHADDPHPISWLQTAKDFGCTQYEPREIE